MAMGRKAFIAAIAISLFLISLLVGMNFRIVEADPFVVHMPPSSPTTDPPKITLESPSNITYYSRDVLLSFTLTGCYRSLAWPNDGPYYNLVSVGFDLDGQKHSLRFSTTQDNQSFSTLLTGLANGSHTATVDVEASSTYATDIVQESGYSYMYQINYYYPRASETINFTINSSIQTATPITSAVTLSSTTPNLSPIYLNSPSSTQQLITPASQFLIPNNHGEINFGTYGNCNDSILKDNAWIFTNLTLQDNQTYFPSILDASTQNSNATIVGYAPNSGIVMVPSGLNYTALGDGVQKFNFNLVNPPSWYRWSVTINDVAKPQDDGWTISNDGWVTIANAVSPSDVNIGFFYVGPPDMGAPEPNFTPILAIALALIVALTISGIVLQNYFKKKQESRTRTGSILAILTFPKNKSQSLCKSMRIEQWTTCEHRRA